MLPQRYEAVPKQANSIATIDGYTFVNFTWPNAANLWCQLYITPGYVSRPPITSISVTVDVSGTVNP